MFMCIVIYFLKIDGCFIFMSNWDEVLYWLFENLDIIIISGI